MIQVLISIEDNLSKDDRQFILDGLDTYNGAHAPDPNHRELIVMSRREGKIIGGLLGHTHWTWLYIKILWVAEDFRKCGLGRDLMLTAEREATLRGCLHSHCNTFAFQALPFYKKLGYTDFGKLETILKARPATFSQKRDLLSSF